MHIAFNDPQVQASFISAIATIFSAIVAAFVAAFVGKYISKKNHLEERLRLAAADIAFLLEVERQLCEVVKTSDGVNPKIRIRQATKEKGLEWSGKYTPSRFAHDIGKGRKYANL